MVVETQLNRSAQMSPDGRSEAKPILPASIRESLNLLHILQYRILNTAAIGIGDEVEFARNSKDNSTYPRFHLHLATSAEISQLEISKFHIDIAPHKSIMDFEMRDDEIRRIIRELEVKKKNSAQNEEKAKDEALNKLLYLFGSELLFGDIREIDRTMSREERWNRLHVVKNFKYLKGDKRHSWIQRKNLLPTEDL